MVVQSRVVKGEVVFFKKKTTQNSLWRQQRKVKETLTSPLGAVVTRCGRIATTSEN